MAKVLQLWEQMQADPEYQSLAPADKEWVTRHFLAKHRKDPDMQDPAYKQQVIATVRGIEQAPKVDAVTNPVEAFGRSFTHEAANNTLTGHAVRAGAKTTGMTDGSEFFGNDFYTDDPFASAAAFGGRLTAQVLDPTNLVPVTKGVQAAGQVGRAVAGTTFREAVPAALQAAAPAMRGGAIAGGGFSAADGAAQRYLADENPFDPMAIAGDTIRGAALGAGLAGALPAARALPGREYQIPGFGPKPEAPLQNAFDNAGIPQQYQDFLRGGEMPMQAAQPVQPVTSLVPEAAPMAPEALTQTFTPEPAPQAIPQSPDYVMVTARGKVPVKVIGRSQSGHLVVDDGTSRITISENLLEPAGAFPEGNIVPRFGGRDPLSLEEFSTQMEGASAQYPKSMGGIVFDGDENAAAFTPDGFQPRPNPNPGDPFWGNPPARRQEPSQPQADPFAASSLPVPGSGAVPFLADNVGNTVYVNQNNMGAPIHPQQIPAPAGVRDRFRPAAPETAPPAPAAPQAPQPPRWTPSLVRGEGMQVAQQRPAPTPQADPPPRPSPIQVVADGSPESTPSQTPENIAPETPPTTEKTGPLDEWEVEHRRYLSKLNSYGALSDQQKQDLHALNQRMKANRPGNEVRPQPEAVKSPAGIEPAASQQEAPAVGAAEGVGAMAASDSLTATDFVNNKMETVAETPTGEKMAGNVNVANISTLEDVQAMTEALANRHHLKMMSEKRGVRTWEQEAEDAAEMLASRIGMSPGQLLSRQKGEVYNAAQLKAAADIVQTSYETMVRPAFERIKGGDNSDAAKLEAAKAVELHVAYMANAYGARSEVARALNAAKMIGDVNKRSAAEIKEMLNQLGGGDKYENIADILGDLENSGDVGRVLRNLNEPTWAEMASEYFINNILSGPPTQIANNVGNFINVSGKLAETAVAAAVGGAKEKLTGRRATVTMGELREQFFAIAQGINEGSKLALHSAKTGDSGFSKEHNIVGEGSQNVESRKAIPGIVGEAARIPSRLLTVGDDFWKGIVYRMELNGLAYRDAVGRGLKGDELTQEVTRLINEPTPEMVTAARNEARYRTFTDPMTGNGLMGIEKIGSAVMRAKSGTTKVQLELQASDSQTARIAGSVLNGSTNLILNTIVPFVRTPIKIVNYAAERSPLAILVPEFWADYAKGGANQEMALSKLAVGSAMVAFFYSLASEGMFGFGMTGGGESDWRKSKQERELGFQPNSLTKDGESYSLQKFGNIGMIAGTAADLAKAIKEGATSEQQFHLVSAMMRSVWKNFGEQTFWQGINEFMEMVSDPDKNVNKFVAGRAAGFVPYSSLLGRAAMSSDKTLRETESKDLNEQIVNTVKSRLPGVSQTLPEKTDLTGKPITRDQEGIEMLLSPSKRTSQKDNPILREFARLEMNVSGPNKKITPIRKRQVELSEDEFRRYKELYGEEMENRLTRTINGDNYKAHNEDKQWQKNRLGRLIDSIGDRARNRLLQEFPDIRKRARNEERK